MEMDLGHGRVALIDEADYELVKNYRWYPLQTKHHCYAVTSRPTQYMHRLILGAPRGVLVDHRNGDTLDNRRENLRLATRGQNQVNSPGQRQRMAPYRGAYYLRSADRWIAQLGVNGRIHYLGSFTTPERAARAWDQAAREHFGEFAYQNFPSN